MADPASDLSMQLPLSESERRRGRRVLLLMAALIVFGLGDLALTITHAFSIGMNEVNPIGAYLIGADSIWGLTLFKCGTIGLTVGLLTLVRHRPIAEAASWMLTLVMVSLTLHWYQYNVDLATELANTNYNEVALKMKLALAEAKQVK